MTQETSSRSVAVYWFAYVARWFESKDVVRLHFRRKAGVGWRAGDPLV